MTSTGITTPRVGPSGGTKYIISGDATNGECWSKFHIRRFSEGCGGPCYYGAGSTRQFRAYFTPLVINPSGMQ